MCDRLGSPRPRPRHAVRAYVCSLALLGALTVAAYGSVWSAGLVYEDRDWRHAPVSGWPTIGSYRATLLLTRLNAAVGGDTPRSDHVANVLVHLLNGVLIATVAGGITRPRTALVAAGLFLLHPLQTEAVAYVTGRSELILAAGILSGRILLARAHGIGAGLSGLLALAAKPAGLTAPALILWGTRPTWACWRWPLAIWALALGSVARGLWSLARNPYLSWAGVSHPVYAWRQLCAVGRSLGAVVLPIGQTIDHDPQRAGAAALGLLVWLGVFVSVRRPARRHLLTMLAWIAVALAPRFIARIPEYLNEHQFYVPMIGVSLCVGRLVGEEHA